MKLKKYKTRELKTLSLLVLVALLAVLTPPSLTDSVAYAQDAVPPELTATSRVASQVELSWTEVSGASYVIARYDRTARRWETLENSYSGLSRTDSSVQAGRSYTYQISADGRNTWSNQETVFVGHYDAPTLNTPTVSTLPSMIDVSWSAVAGTDNYDLWRFEQTESWVQVADGQTGTSYSDSSVDPGKSYLYQVQAHGALGAGAWSDQQSASVPRTAPSMPVNLQASPGDAQVMLSWTEPLYNGGSIITGYQYRYQMAGGSWSSWMDTSPTLSRAATVSSLTNGSDHNFEVRARNAIGDGAVAAATAMPMSTVPGTPTNLRSTGVGPNEIMLAWDAVAGATGYAIQRRVNGGNWVDLTGVSGMAHTDTGLTPSTSYDYEIKATNNSGDSPWSGTLTVSTGPPQAPAAPPLTVSAMNFTVTLSWTAPNDGGEAITSYEIEYSTDGSTWMTLEPAAAASATSYEDANLPGGTMRYYQIRAINSVGNGAWSASMSAAVAPAAPVLQAEPGYQRVVLTWTISGAAPVTSYRIDKLNAQSNWAMEASLPGTTDPLRYTDTGLADSTVHTYRIIAINDAGESGESNSAAATTLAQPVGAPGPPTGLSATSGSGMVTLSWSAPLFNGGAPVTEYEYRYKEDTVAAWTGIGWMSAGEMTMVEVKPLKPAILYDFEVRALNSAGAGEAVNSDTLDVALRTPGPTGPTAVPVLRTTLGTHAGTSITTSPHLSNATITLSWDALGGAAQNGGDPITGYEICYKKSTDSAWMIWPDPATTGFTDPDGGTGAVRTATHGVDDLAALLDPGTTYQYRARALNTVVDFEGDNAITREDDCTHWDGDWSAMVSATTGVVEPEEPTLHPTDGVLADPTATPPVPAQAAWDVNVNSITIRWTPSMMSGGADITGFEVWVGTPDENPDTGLGSECETDAAEIAALMPTVTGLPAMRLEYISPGLTADTVYCYRVRARNGSGDGRVSEWSNEVRARTTVTQAGTPGQPGQPTGTHASGNVTVTWAAPADPGNSPILHYEVQYQEDVTANTDDDWSDATTVMETPAVPPWIHMDAPGGKMFEYRVRAVNDSGAGAWSDASVLVTVDPRAASAPMLTATSAGTDEILLEWNTPQDNGMNITGYVIQRWDPDASPDPAWDETNQITVAGIGATVYSDIGVIANDGTLTTPLMAGTTYYYRIRASGETPGPTEGTWSAATMAEAASATTEMGVPETPRLGVGNGTTTPAGFDAGVTLDENTTAPTTDSITLYWQAPGNGGSAITGYELRMWDETANSGAGDWVFVASPAADATSHKHDGLEPGTMYHYILFARNAIGASGWSPDVSGRTMAGNPDAPELTATATGPTSIRLTWTVPDDNGTPITGYQLVRWDNADPGAWGTENLLTEAALADGDAETVTEFVDTGLTAGTKYYYRIRAIPQVVDTDEPTDGLADEGWSADDMDDATSETTPGDTLAQPQNVAVGTPTASSLTITWDAVTPLAGGTAVTGYDVQIWDRDTGMWADEASLGVVLTYTDRGLMAGTKYYYRVRAKNSQGPGPFSGYESNTTTPAAPDAPVLTATAQGMNAIRLTWTVPDDNGMAITGYQLQRWDPDADPNPTWGANLLGDDNTTTLFVDEMLEAGTRYHYRIRAMPQVDTPGSVSGLDDEGWSATKSETTVAGRPSKPTLTATADGQTAINLSWSFADTTPANGSAIVRYELQMWDKDARMWTFVHNALPSTRTSYRHDSLTAGTRYVYRIRAVNGAADNGGLGHWSTIQFETTAE